MGTLQVGGTTLGVKNTVTNKVDLSNVGDVTLTSSANIKGAINASGDAPIYACRAWVNFDGTKDTSGAPSTANTNRLIRASGNVASVLRNGTGDYTITFTTPMPDANYCAVPGSGGTIDYDVTVSNYATGSIKLYGDLSQTGGSPRDINQANLAIFR